MLKQTNTLGIIPAILHARSDEVIGRVHSLNEFRKARDFNF